MEIGTRDLWAVLRGFRVALTRDDPFDADRLPDGWNFPDRAWPSEWSRPTGYWVSIWRDGGKCGEHITIKPAEGGWWVNHDPENSWTGGNLLGPKFEAYERAVGVAIDAMERLESGEERRAIRYGYDLAEDDDE